MAEKFSLNDIKREDHKRVDISEFLNQGAGTVFIEVRRYTTKEKAILLDLYRIIENNDQKKNIKEVIAEEGGAIEEMSIRSVFYGVDSEADDFPFAEWSPDFVREINKRNSELYLLLKNEVESLNVPLAKEK